MRWGWAPSPKWKAETIGTRYHEMLTRKQEQLALLPTAPIVVVSMRTESDLRVLHCTQYEGTDMQGITCERYADERSLLASTRNYLEATSDESILIGHNILHFDLPKLRGRMLRHGIRLPDALTCRDQPVFDSMREFAQRYTTDDRQHISLSEVLESLGMANHKGYVDGTLVQQLWEGGRHELLLQYAAADVLAEYGVFLALTGQAGT